ncbi:MAG: response regulator transcription factor [Sphingobacteriia bacterium]|nr:response regulator transcription factor [Sphingobacteriia bacterium]
MKTPINVVVCDDHALFRKSVTGLLNTFERITCISDVANGKELITEMHGGLSPSVVLMDIKMPVMNGYETAYYLKENFPAVKILAMSIYDNDYAIEEILACGADAFVSKDADPNDVYDAIIGLHDKGRYMTKWMKQNKKRLLGLQRLTPRERELLSLFCSEKSYAEISQTLHISLKTVDRYRDEVFKKMKVKSRLNLVLFAIQNGIVV